MIFSDTLDLAGDKLEAGKNVLISVEGEAEGEAMKVRVQAVQSLDEVLGKGIKADRDHRDGEAPDGGPDQASEPRGQP